MCPAGSSRTTTTPTRTRSRRVRRWQPGAFLALDVESAFGLGSSDSARLYLAGRLARWWTPTPGPATRAPRTAAARTAPARSPPPSRRPRAPRTPARQPPAYNLARRHRGHDRRRVNVFGTNLSGLSFESRERAVGGRERPQHALPPGTERLDLDARHQQRLDVGQVAALPRTAAATPTPRAWSSTPDGMFVSTERDNNDSGTSLPEILRFDATSTASSLNATAEWNLTVRPAVRRREQWSRRHLVDSGHVPDRARVPRRAHRRRLRPCHATRATAAACSSRAWKPTARSTRTP